MNRIDIIQALINKNNYKSYLEIGVRDGSCFNAIQCERKEGVDPDPTSAATYLAGSDYFFENSIQMFDIIFIDGLHHSEQVSKDIENALNHLTDGGTIVMHDCLPTSEKIQEIPMRPDHNEWCGDTWKSFVKLRSTREDLQMRTVSTDWGCGIIRMGKQDYYISPVAESQLTYQNFEKYKNTWLNVISVEDFKRLYL
jgi:hypothetical protein